MLTSNISSDKKAVLLLLIFLYLPALAGCDRTRQDKGYEYFPDMAHSKAYETYSENPAMDNNRTMRNPVEGTVPRHMIPYPYPEGFEGREQAAEALENPFEGNELIVQQGDSIYNIFCENCHGTQGDGQGILFTSGRYIIPPASLKSESLQKSPSGEIYHVITTGWGVMGPHGFLIPPEDRWKIVTFVEEVFHE